MQLSNVTSWANVDISQLDISGYTYKITDSTAVAGCALLGQRLVVFSRASTYTIFDLSNNAKVGEGTTAGAPNTVPYSVTQFNNYIIVSNQRPGTTTSEVFIYDENMNVVFNSPPDDYGFTRMRILKNHLIMAWTYKYTDSANSKIKIFDSNLNLVNEETHNRDILDFDVTNYNTMIVLERSKAGTITYGTFKLDANFMITEKLSYAFSGTRSFDIIGDFLYRPSGIYVEKYDITSHPMQMVQRYTATTSTTDLMNIAVGNSILSMRSGNITSRAFDTVSGTFTEFKIKDTVTTLLSLGNMSNGYYVAGLDGAYAVVFNQPPTITDNTENNKTFYEADTITLNGFAKDIDNGNILNIKYKINNGTTRAIATVISNGVTSLNYSKVLKYTANTLKDGETVVASGLVDGQTYSITIWAEDDQGGKSGEVARNFYVVPNRPPILTIDAIENQLNKINSEKINITGSVTDADNNNVTVNVRINSNSSIQIYEGVPSDFTFNIKISDLTEGENIITVITKDTFDFTTTKTIKLNKNRKAVPVKEAIARYKVKPPSGSAKQILAWIQREVGDLAVDADISMVLDGEQEQYSPMTKLTAPISDEIEEDEFAFESEEEKDNITLKLKLSKEDASSDKSIKQISGVLK